MKLKILHTSGQMFQNKYTSEVFFLDRLEMEICVGGVWKNNE